MLINAPENSVHFFLVGPRAPLGGTGPIGERVGTLVQRARIDAAGQPLDAEEVLATDVKFDDADVDSPVRYEAEIATYKPAPDVAIVSDAPSYEPFPPAPDPETPLAFGTIEIRRAGQPAPGPVFNRDFDWLARGESPRVDDAGQKAPPPNDGSTLEGFIADDFDLPRNYTNAFQNGQPVVGQPFFRTGDEIIFTPNAGLVRSVIIPEAPMLAALDADGAPLQSPPVLDPIVDTVVLDIADDVFTLTWRTTFPWEDRFEAATLEVATDG